MEDSASFSAPPHLQAARTATTSSRPQDEISLFLHQTMLRSSSSSVTAQTNQKKQATSSFSSNLICNNARTTTSQRLPSADTLQPQSISIVDSFHVYDPVPAYDHVRPHTTNASIENEPDDYECESEDQDLEALAEDHVPTKPPPTHRSSSKRSRAAEVHNLSEKRRRSRINDKMKALQNLIPNSNKTDKASMLDEAIEYLKRLQLQVQMLSMRNGLMSLHPMSLPAGSMRVLDLGEDHNNSNSYCPNYSDKTGMFESLNPSTVLNHPLAPGRDHLGVNIPGYLFRPDPSNPGNDSVVPSYLNG